jgi:KaiC/GvpD/RAD55 family RecA-like ATPase
MQRKRPFITVIILIGLLTAAGSLLINMASGGIVISPWVAWPLLIGVIFAGIGLAVWQYLLQTETDRAKGIVNLQNRQRLLAKVYAFWIKGVLEQSLHGAALIALGLQEKPNALADPWQLVLQQPDRPDHPLPAGTRITQVYDNAGGELLILGEPGSGKTTLLLELARDLLDRARQKDDHPMPVVFNLSSWAVKRQTLKEWLIEELNVKYQVPRLLSRSWVEADAVLPLLDGLDEVSPNYREQCVETINAYRREHMISTVVCSRNADYLSQRARLLLHSAVMVKLLTVQQIDTYISSAERQLAGLRVALRDDPILQELATTPLMLGVLTMAYHGKSVEELRATGSIESRRQQVFAAYVRRMLQRRSIKKRYTTQQMMHWLAWLGQEMIKWKQTEFSIEWKPSWLPERTLRLYQSLVRGLLSGLAFGLLVGFFTGVGVGVLVGVLVGLFAGVFGTRPIIRIILFGVFIGLTFVFLVGQPFGALVGVFVGLTFGLPFWLIVTFYLSILYIDDMGRSILYQSFAGFRSGVLKGLEFGLFVGACVGLFFGVLIGLLVGSHSGLLVGLRSGLLIGLHSGLIFGLIVGVCTSEFVEQVVLRLLLRRIGYMPWNYPEFLDYAAERILLRKIGGSYIFVHRLLLEYFAALETDK